MKKSFCLLVLSYFVLFNHPLLAQFNDWAPKYGFQASLLFPENEYANLGFSGNDNFSFDWYKTSFLGEIFAGFEFSSFYEVRLSAGYGFYSGKAVFAKDTYYGEYKSTIIPITAKLRISPFDLVYWNPYFSIGAGVMNYNLETAPNIKSALKIESSGWTANIPISFGAEFFLSERLMLDFSIGEAFSSTSSLDAYSSKSSEIWDSYVHTSIGLSYAPENCMLDTDMDGLGKCDEKSAGADPDKSDTDNDGLLDGEEYHSYKTDPLKADTDSDGLEDGIEVRSAKSNPLVPDTDDDGLNDKLEYEYKTDPNAGDTDKDGFLDKEEIEKYKTNPLLPDSDNDGLYDGYEIFTSKTDPLSADSDKDGLTDSDEVKIYKTDPLMADTDGDELDDSIEVLKLKTDPLRKDTDKGTASDYIEYIRGTDPLNAEDDVIKLNVSIVLEGITFAKGSAEITPESETVLKKILQTMESYPDMYIEISGHTDDVGDPFANQRLSDLRAREVRIWLIAHGVSGERITAKGYGQTSPLVPNDSPENRKINRRIEFKRIK